MKARQKHAAAIGSRIETSDMTGAQRKTMAHGRVAGCVEGFELIRGEAG